MDASTVYRILIPFLLGGLFMGAVGIYAMHQKYDQLCEEIKWQSPMCQRIMEHW